MTLKTQVELFLLNTPNLDSLVVRSTKEKVSVAAESYRLNRRRVPFEDFRKALGVVVPKADSPVLGC